MIPSNSFYTNLPISPRPEFAPQRPPLLDYNDPAYSPMAPDNFGPGGFNTEDFMGWLEPQLQGSGISYGSPDFSTSLGSFEGDPFPQVNINYSIPPFYTQDHGPQWEPSGPGYIGLPQLEYPPAPEPKPAQPSVVGEYSVPNFFPGRLSKARVYSDGTVQGIQDNNRYFSPTVYSQKSPTFRIEKLAQPSGGGLNAPSAAYGQPWGQVQTTNQGTIKDFNGATIANRSGENIVWDPNGYDDPNPYNYPYHPYFSGWASNEPFSAETSRNPYYTGPYGPQV